jgi:hypothetical protein
MLGWVAVFGCFGGMCIPILKKAIALLNGQTLLDVFPTQEHLMGWVAGLILFAFVGGGVAFVIEKSHPFFRAVTTGLTLPATISALAGGGISLAVDHSIGIIGQAFAGEAQPTPATTKLNKLCEDGCFVFFRDDNNSVIERQFIPVWTKGTLFVPFGATEIEAINKNLDKGVGKLPAALSGDVQVQEPIFITEKAPGFITGFFDAIGLHSRNWTVATD